MFLTLIFIFSYCDYVSKQQNIDFIKQFNIIFIDLKKAFDSVSYNFLINNINVFGVGNYFLRW